MTSTAIHHTSIKPLKSRMNPAHAGLFLAAASLVTTAIFGGSLTLIDAQPRAVVAVQPTQTLVVTATRLIHQAGKTDTKSTHVAAAECKTAVC